MSVQQILTVADLEPGDVLVRQDESLRPYSERTVLQRVGRLIHFEDGGLPLAGPQIYGLGFRFVARGRELYNFHANYW